VRVKVNVALSDPVNAVGPLTFETDNPRYRVRLDPLVILVESGVGAPLDLEIATKGPLDAAESSNCRTLG
jgi:hypothetical protein